MAQRVIRKGAGRLWEQNINDNFTELFDRTPVSVMEFGAVGDWDGSAGTDDTTAINAALDWWAAEDGRVLYFPPGWFYYDDQKDMDLSGAKWNTIKCAGRIWFADAGASTGNPIAWTIHNCENLCLDLRIQGGGKLGTFSSRSPNDGGTTAVKLHDLRWAKIDIEAMDYAGRVLHTTAEATTGTARARNMNIHMVTGNRTTNPENVRVGQPIYADSNACDQTGSWGKFDWRGEGTMHGPVFERLNDVRIPDVEAGLFSTSGWEFRGCVVVHIDSVYTGQSDNASAPGVKFETSSAGRKCGDVYIGRARMLTATAGIHASDFDTTLPGLVIGSLAATQSDSCLHIEDMHSVTVGKVEGDDLVNAVVVAGANGRINLGFGSVTNVTGDVLSCGSATWDFMKLTGHLEGGVASYSLLDLGTANNKTEISMDLESSVAAQLITIGFAGSNKVRMIGGSVTTGGSTTNFNGSRIPELLDNVRGIQTVGIGSATITNGNTSVSVTHNLERTPQIVTVMGTDAETASAYVTSIGSSTFTINVPSAVTADRSVYWRADATKTRGDLDA